MTTIDQLCQLPPAYHAGVILLVALAQMILNQVILKTEKVQSESLLEFIFFAPIKFAFNKLFRKGKTDENSL